VLANLARGFDAVELGQVYIHHDHIRLQCACQIDGGPAVTGLFTNLEIGTRLEQRTETTAHDFVVIDEEDSSLHIWFAYVYRRSFER